MPSLSKCLLSKSVGELRERTLRTVELLALKHAVIGLPVPPPQSIPESQGLGSFIALMYCHVAAAVQACFQGTSVRGDMMEVY